MALAVGPAQVEAVTRPTLDSSFSGDPASRDELFAAPRSAANGQIYDRYLGEMSDREKRLLADAVDFDWDEFSLLEAALIAGGTTDTERFKCAVSRFEQLAETLRNGIDLGAEPEIVIQRAFEFMHGRILTGGYQLECTDLAATLESGRFNCVSSTVLFNCLAANLGFQPVALELPGHAMSRLPLGGKNLDVETTCPRWFLLRHDPKRRAALIAKTIGAGVSPSAKNPGREVSEVELVAMIYYNRGVDLLTEHRFAEAAAANAKALRLDPASETALGNLLATLNNWAITLGAKHDYQRAINLLEQGLAIDRQYETFSANYVHLHYQWSDRLCAAGHFEKALQILRTADAGLLGADRLAQLRLDVYRRWATRLPGPGQSGQAIEMLKTAEAECRAAGEMLQKVEAQILADWAASLARENRHSEAVILLDWGLQRQPASELLSRSRREALDCWTGKVSGVRRSTSN